MGLYGRYILPRLIQAACSEGNIMRQRAKVVPLAHGNVLEVGMGPGLNLPYYQADKVTRLWGLEPSPQLMEVAVARANSLAFPVDFIPTACRDLPLGDASLDAVVITYTLCTIRETLPALREMRRVLKPAGKLLFCEHGLAPDEDVRRWQNRINPVWKPLAGGCHLNRPIPALIEEAGFRITQIETMYLPGWRPPNYNYWGAAVPGAG